jgi:hypothetical protein
MSDVQNEVINEAVESIPEEVVEVVETKPTKGSILPSPETIGQNIVGGVVTSVATAVLVKCAGYVAGRVADGTRFLAGKVHTKINELQRLFPDAKEEYLATKDDLRALGVTPQTTYLYMQGHHLFDTVVTPILSKVCNILRQERQNEIYYASAHKTQKRNEMSCYENSLQDIKTMLKKNTGYMPSEQFRRLQNDIRSYLDKSL